jgi:hypothetical protein
MGFFQRKVPSEESVLSSLLITFGQSIDAVEKGSAVEVPVAWDLFVNMADVLQTSNLISEHLVEAVVYSSNFKIGRDLVLDLAQLRGNGSESSEFAENFHRVMELQFPLNLSFQRLQLSPKLFADVLVSNSKDVYPLFGATIDDQKFYAIIGIFLATAYSDSDLDKDSQKVFRRSTVLTLGLQFFSQWNIAKRIMG